MISSVNVTTLIADLVTFTEEILNGKLHFLCSVKQTYILYTLENNLLNMYQQVFVVVTADRLLKTSDWYVFEERKQGDPWQGQKIILLFPEMRVTRGIFTWAAANLFFYRFSGDIIFSSLVSLAFFLCWFFVGGLFFEIKNIYPDAHSIMRVGK